MSEIWKSVVGYEGLYEVSNLGNVRSLNFNHTGEIKLVKIHPWRGYMKVALCNNNKKKWNYVHRLVAQAFIPNPDNLPQVNHKNEIRDDNRVENLEWCTAKYNNHYSRTWEKGQPRAVDVLKKPVIQLTKEGKYVDEYESLAEAQRQTGIHKNGIWYCCKGERKSAGGYAWIYK